MNDTGSETHEEEKDSNARLEPCDAVIRLEVQPTDDHAEQHGYHDMREKKRLVPKPNSSTLQPCEIMNFHTNRRNTFHSLPASTSNCVKNAAALFGLASFFKAPPPPRSFGGALMMTALNSLSKLGLSCSCCCCCASASPCGGVCAKSRR